MYIKLLSFALATTFSANVLANTNLQKQLENVGATNVKINDTVLPGFKMASSDQGVVYISQDGRFVIYGKVFELKNGKAVDLTNQSLMKDLDALKDQMIIYSAKNQKHIITVFTDISCQYCRLLTSKIKEYNELGITVRYLAFPRSGMNTQAAKQMEAIWTAKDPAFALNEAEKGNLPNTLKTPDRVKKHYELGIKFGITGTPSIITENGEVLAGFIAPNELIQILNH